VPPAQDAYLHFTQRASFHNLDLAPFTEVNHDLAGVETPGDLIVSDALTVEAWILWEGSDWDEVQAATGIDMDTMTLFCGQRAYGFHYRWAEAPGWTFFLQTDAATDSILGDIPVPLGEWAHIAATFDGVTVRTFLNGVQQHVENVEPGSIPVTGDAFLSQKLCDYPTEDAQFPPSQIFGIGLGLGFSGGMRQVRIWNRALAEAEILANAGLHLSGTEPGLVGYWPMDDPQDPSQAANKVAGGPPLKLGFAEWTGLRVSRPTWQLTDPLFVVREDLAENAVVMDCPSLAFKTRSFVDVQDDGDLDLIFSGTVGPCDGDHHAPIRALIRDGANGFVFDTSSAIAGPVPLMSGTHHVRTADFNGDERMDIFFANTGPDFCGAVGAPNTLLLSRPDGLLEDASGNLLGAPCNSDSPQFEGQRRCFGGGGAFGRTPGIRYPGTGEAIVPDPDYTHSVAVGDTDGDGDVDILVGNAPYYNLEEPYLLLNDGQGGFLANWQLLPDFLYGVNPEDDIAISLGLLVEDLDGDGHADLVTSPSSDPTTGVWVGGISWNDGTGDFSTADQLVIVPTVGIPDGWPNNGRPYSSGAMVAADVDNDGDKDLLIVWDDAGQAITDRNSLQILVNHGGRVFTDETVQRAGVPPQAGMTMGLVVREFSAEDINADGCPDLLFPVDQGKDQGAPIWLNDCSGNFTFATQTRYVLPKPGSVYTPFDYDGDGDVDYLSAITQGFDISGTAGCSIGEAVTEGNDYIDFAVLLNQSPPDTDGDGVSDIHDAFDNDPDEWFDADSDGIGNNADDDDDNDGIPDIWERNNGNNVFDAADAGNDGDTDGLTSLQEYQAGTDPRNSDTDGDSVLDGVDNCPVVTNLSQHDTDQDGVGNACKPVAPVALADLNSNGSPEVAVLVRGSAHVHIRDGSTDELISDIDFGADDALQMTVLPDLDASGDPEIAVLNEQASGQVRVQIRDSVTGGIVSNLWYGLQYQPVSMDVVTDYSGNGFPEVAVLGSEAGTDAVRVQIRDADSNTFLDNVFLGTQSIAKDLVSMTDTSGNGIPEMGILGVLKANDQVRMQIWDAQTSAFQSNVWFAKVYQPHSTITMPDINSNGSDEIVAVGVDPATQNVRVQVRDSDTTATLFNIWLGNVNEAVDIALINDINSDGFPDLAVLLKTPAGVGRVRVQSGDDGAFIRNLFYSVVENPVGLAVMPDYSGNGFDELAALGKSAGMRHVQILDTSTGGQVNRIDYP